MAITGFNGILYGGDYCPEQWPEEVWLEDVRIMKYYGVNAVTINVHSWCVVQPQDAPYDFTRMDKIVRLLDQNGINIVMATGTAALPNWLLVKYPDIMATDMYGVRNKPAKRVNFCPNSPDYRREIRNMCEALAEHYKDQKNIILWHLSNELEDRCYCETCAAAYRKWLKEKYGTLEELNRTWNTMFWGHEYTSWEQIHPPVYDNMIYRNVDGKGIDISAFPTETIEYLRFTSESFRQCFEIEKEAIRKYIRDAIVTNNFQYRNHDYDVLAKPLDVISYDTYPSKDEPPYMAAFNYDLTRSIRSQDPFLIMEMSPNHASWEMCAAAKRPGEVSLIAMSALARGAESAMFFQIRRSRAGFEKFHGAMIEHSGRTDTRQGQELKKLGDTLHKFGSEFLGSRIKAEVAVVADWNNKWGVEIPSSIQKQTSYFQQVMHYYEWFYSQNIAVDIVRGNSDLSQYRMVVAPMMYMMDEDDARNIKTYVKNGGLFVTTYFSGMADREDNIWLGGYPGLLQDMLGLWVEETDALKAGTTNKVKMSAMWDSGEYECSFLCDLIRDEGAEVIARYGSDFYQGVPCVTENQYGQGKAVYIGTKPDKALLASLMAHYSEDAGVRPVLSTPEGVEAVIRERDDEKYLFLLNHTTREVVVSLNGTCRDLLTDEAVDQVILPSRGYMAGKCL